MSSQTASCSASDAAAPLYWTNIVGVVAAIVKTLGQESVSGIDIALGKDKDKPTDTVLKLKYLLHPFFYIENINTVEPPAGVPAGILPVNKDSDILLVDAHGEEVDTDLIRFLRHAQYGVVIVCGLPAVIDGEDELKPCIRFVRDLKQHRDPVSPFYGYTLAKLIPEKTADGCNVTATTAVFYRHRPMVWVDKDKRAPGVWDSASRGKFSANFPGEIRSDALVVSRNLIQRMCADVDAPQNMHGYMYASWLIVAHLIFAIGHVVANNTLAAAICKYGNDQIGSNKYLISDAVKAQLQRDERAYQYGRAGGFVGSSAYCNENLLDVFSVRGTGYMGEPKRKPIIGQHDWAQNIVYYIDRLIGTHGRVVVKTPEEIGNAIGELQKRCIKQINDKFGRIGRPTASDHITHFFNDPVVVRQWCERLVANMVNKAIERVFTPKQKKEGTDDQ